jgi:riboflavin kinase/FMN adenylyltransferase
MLIFRALQSPDHQPVALTIGNFDGVHLGHKALLSRLLAEAKLRGIPSAVVIFEPHPREFFTPDQAPARLTSLREKLELLAELGVDRVHICRFNSKFAQMSANDFIDALHKKLSVKYVLIGDDFRFGSGRSGDFALMEKIAIQQGFKVEAMHSVLYDGLRVSSTAVRATLASGHMRAAKRFLGRPYSISGRVVHGDKLGREIGFPTANVQMKHNRPPLSGIFVVRVTGDHIPPQHGAASLGVRPTVHAN